MYILIIYVVLFLCFVYSCFFSRCIYFNLYFILIAYVSQHPGGDTILNNAGGDSTAGVHGPHHPPSMWDVLADHYIGELAE